MPRIFQMKQHNRVILALRSDLSLYDGTARSIASITAPPGTPGRSDDDLRASGAGTLDR